MDQLTPSPQLFPRIMAEIERQQRLAVVRRRAFWHGFLFLAAAAGVLFVGRDFLNQMRQSEFFQLSGLLWTDFTLVMAHIGDYASSLLESIPAFTSATLSLILLTALFTGSQLLKDGAELKRLKV